jgi:type IV pilus assembly protein PilC
MYPQIPGIFTQMIRVGEETGRVSNVLDTMAKFYEREVVNAVDSLVGLIEPVMIVLLGVGVGGLLASVLIPIYNITGSI